MAKHNVLFETNNFIPSSFSKREIIVLRAGWEIFNSSAAFEMCW